MSLSPDPLLGTLTAPAPGSDHGASPKPGQPGRSSQSGYSSHPGGTSPSPSADRDEDSLDIWRIYAVFIKWLWLIATVVAVAFTAVAFWTFRQVRIYRADASVVIDLTAPQVLKGIDDVVGGGIGNFWSTQEYFGTQYRVIKSRLVAEKVVARLGLDQDYGFLGIDPKLEPKRRAEIARNADPVQRVMDAILVSPVKDSRVVIISVEDASPQRAADLANAVAEEYIEQNVDRKLVTTHGASAWLAQQVTTAKKSLEASERALYDFKQQNDVLSTSMEARQNIYSERVVELNAALNRAEIRRYELEARREALAQIIEDSKGAEFAAEAFKPIVDNMTIAALKSEYNRLRMERAELSDRYLDGHPKLQQIEQRIGKLKEAIAHTCLVIQKATEYEYQQAAKEERKLKNALEDAKNHALTNNRLEMDFERFRREKDRNQQVYDVMMKRQKEVEVAGLLRTNNLRMLDTALVPKSPVRPNRAQNLGFALLIGFLLGCSLAVLLETLDSTVKSQDDVESYLGLPLLGILPSIPHIGGDEGSRDNTIQRDLYVAANPKSSIAECARAVRTSLLFSSPDHPFKVLMVASCGPREGKTTSMISIGITMAQSGSRVLLIDADLRRPRLHRTFNCSSQHGLSTLILGESTPEQAIKSTGIDRLFVLPAGPVPPNPAEILQSARYTEVMEDLASRFDRVILDSPPVGVVTDALIMAAQADGLIMVLRAGSTPKKAARRGKRALVDVKAHIYGAVLNDVELGSRVGQYYNYYHYYRYGYYPDSSYGYGGTEGPPDDSLSPPTPPSATASSDDGQGQGEGDGEQSPRRRRRRRSAEA